MYADVSKYVIMSEDNTKQAAFFDFDGIIFREQSGWKIVHPAAGYLGTGMAWNRACAAFESILKKNPSARVDEYFTLDNYEAPSGQLNHEWNLLPMNSVVQTARSHIYRQRNIFILSTRFYPGMESFIQRIYEKYNRPPKPGEFPYPENPFESPSIITLDGSHPVKDLSKLTSIELKLSMLTGLLTRNEGMELCAGNQNRETYEKIFLYFTEPQYKDLIQNYLNDNRNCLSGGRNAIVPFYLANVQSVNL